MQAIILAGGLGSRIPELTKDSQKVMLPIGGKALLEWDIELIKKAGIKEFILCVGHMKEKIKRYFWDGENFGADIIYSEENEPLGTAGAVKNAGDLIKGSFLVYYGDNFTNYSIKKLIDFHKRRGGIASIALFEAGNPEEKGAVEFDSSGRILKFIEKPEKSEIKSGLVNAGIYVMEKSVLDYIGKGKPDFGRDVFPRMLKAGEKMYCLPVGDSYFIDIGSYKNYEKAGKDFERGLI